MDKKERIAIISLLQPADVLMITPVVENIKKRNPQSFIVLIINETCDGVKDLLGGADQIFLFHRDEILNRLSDTRYSLVENYKFVKEHLAPVLTDKFDLVINATHNRISGIITSMIEADTVKGLTFDEYGNKWIEEPWFNYLNDVVLVNNRNMFHFIDILANGAGTFVPFKTMPRAHSPELWDNVNKKTGDKNLKSSSYMVFNVDHPDELNVWSGQNFNSLAELLIQKYQEFKIVICSTVLKTEELQKIITAGSDRIIITNFSMPELATVLNSAQLLFSNDFLAIQLGSALNIPVVSVSASSGSFNAWGPYGEGHIIVESSGGQNVSIAAVESAVSFLFNRELFFSIKGALSGGNIMRSRFDKDGFVEYIPLNKSDMGMSCFYNWVYRSVWKNTINRKVVAGDSRRFISLGEKYIDRMVDIDKEVEYLAGSVLNHYSASSVRECIGKCKKDIRGLGILKEMAFEGQQTAKRFLSTVSVPGRPMDEIKKSGNEVKLADERIYKLINDFPFLISIIGAFKSSREDMHIRNLFPLAKKIIFAYEELFARAVFTEEILDKLIRIYNIPDGGMHG